MHNVHRWLFIVAAALALAACGSESTADDPVEPEGAAGPFILDGLPDDFVPVAAGEGTREQDWGTDWGSDEPFVVIGNGERRVKIAATGYQYEGESTGTYPPPGTEPKPGQQYSSGRIVDDDIALRASSSDVDTAELGRLVEAASPQGRRSAPSVEDLPDGWTVIGSSDADVVMSIGQAPGPSGAFGVMWVRGDQNVDNEPRLSAVSLPGRVADTEAWTGDLSWPLPWFGDTHGEALTVEGRPAAFVRVDEGEGSPQHVLLSRRADGSLLVLTSSGTELLSREQLVDLATSARPATEQEWKELGWSTWGGPDLHPDEGDVELARGVEDGTEWLLQATRTPRPDPNVVPDPSRTWFLDPCFKLLGGQRACTAEGQYGIAALDPSFPNTDFTDDVFTIRTTLPGATVRVATPSGTVSAPLHDLPDGSARVAVVFQRPPGLFVACTKDPAQPTFAPDLDVTYIDVLGPEGEFVGCVTE